jgi:hypothetical protein
MTNARVESSPALADGRAFVGSNDGRFYVLDYKTGAKVWEFVGVPGDCFRPGRDWIGGREAVLLWAVTGILPAMSMAFEELEKHARSLSIEEKATLARMLIQELDAAVDPDAEQLWLEEAQRSL